MANLPKDTDTPRWTSAPCAIARTHAHTLHGNAKPTNTLQSADTTRHASSYTRQYATPQRYEAHYTARTTYASSRRTQVLKTKPRKRSSISSITTPTHAEKHPTEVPHQTSTEWLEPLPPEVETRHRRHTNVSQDPRYDQAPTASDSECTEAPNRIPDWILPQETQEALFREGHGTHVPPTSSTPEECRTPCRRTRAPSTANSASS